MKNTFCKVIEFDDCQVLIRKLLSTKEGEHEISITTNFAGIEPAVKMGYETEQKQQEAFEKMDPDSVRGIIDDLKKMLSID